MNEAPNIDDCHGGMPIEFHARIQAAVNAGVSLDRILAHEGVSQQTWEQVDEAWQEALAQSAEEDLQLLEKWDNALAQATTLFSRRIPPIDEHLNAWLDFARNVQAEEDFLGTLNHYGITTNDWLRLQKKWNERLANDPALREEARNHLAVPPGAVPALTVDPVVLPPPLHVQPRLTDSATSTTRPIGNADRDIDDDLDEDRDTPAPAEKVPLPAFEVPQSLFGSPASVAQSERAAIPQDPSEIPEFLRVRQPEPPAPALYGAQQSVAYGTVEPLRPLPPVPRSELPDYLRPPSSFENRPIVVGATPDVVVPSEAEQVVDSVRHMVAQAIPALPTPVVVAPTASEVMAPVVPVGSIPLVATPFAPIAPPLSVGAPIDPPPAPVANWPIAAHVPAVTPEMPVVPPMASPIAPPVAVPPMAAPIAPPVAVPFVAVAAPRSQVAVADPSLQPSPNFGPPPSIRQPSAAAMSRAAAHSPELAGAKSAASAPGGTVVVAQLPAELLARMSAGPAKQQAQPAFGAARPGDGAPIAPAPVAPSLIQQPRPVSGPAISNIPAGVPHHSSAPAYENPQVASIPSAQYVVKPPPAVAAPVAPGVPGLVPELKPLAKLPWEK